MTQPVKYAPIYFAPDLDPSWVVNPGILTSVTDMIPSKRNTLKTIAQADTQDLSNGTFVEATYGVPIIGGIYKQVSGTGRLIVGTATRLMENTGAAWVDRSLSGSAYTTAANWCFTTYGNDLIAVSKANAPQVSTSTTFAALGGSPPKAAVCTTQKNFVLLGDTDDGTSLGDRIWWSGLGNDATWTVSAATQAGNYRLLATPGNVTALVNMRDSVVAYKEDSLYLGDYQGSPLLWTWRLISDAVGCAAMHGVAEVAGIHYFLHRSGVYRFDGASLQPIGQSVNRYLFNQMGSQVEFATAQAVYDEIENTIIWYFRDTGGASNQFRKGLAFNVQTGQYGFIANAWATGTGTCYATVQATLSDITNWLSSQATQSTNILTIGNEGGSGGVLRRPLFGDSAGNNSGSITTGDIGDEVMNTTLTRIKPRVFAFGNTISGANVSAKSAEALSYGSPVSFAGSLAQVRYDGMITGRWLQVQVPMSYYGEVAGLYLTMVQSGSE